jgi:tetratricopeptide (TPR) repeat protein
MSATPQEERGLPTMSDRIARVLDASTGTLEDTPYALLLVALASARATAVLELHRNLLNKTVLFDAGAPVDCRSNIATELLGRFLVSSGKLRESDANSAAAAAATGGVPLGDILTERKLLTPTELYRALQQNLGRKLLEPFSWTDGTWTITENELPLASPLRVKVPQLIVTGIQKVEPQENADAAAAAFEGRHLALASDPRFALDEVRLSAAQQKVVDAARRSIRLEEIRAQVDTDELNRTLYALLLLGLVEPSERPRRETPQFELEVNPFITDPAAVPKATVIEEEPAHATAEEVVAAYLAFRRRDAFELLEVEETAGPVAIIKACLATTERFLPSRFTGDLREKAQEVFLAAARAYAELADPVRRETLIKRREKLREEATAAAKAGPAAMIDPEALWKSGVNLAASGKLREALGSFELAAQCDVQNGTYAAEVAWVRYRLGNTPAMNALKLVKDAIRIDPSAGVAYLYAGELQAILGKKIEAQGYLMRAAALMPNDPRPNVAAKRIP